MAVQARLVSHYVAQEPNRADAIKITPNTVKTALSGTVRVAQFDHATDTPPNARPRRMTRDIDKPWISGGRARPRAAIRVIRDRRGLSQRSTGVHLRSCIQTGLQANYRRIAGSTQNHRASAVRCGQTCLTFRCDRHDQPTTSRADCSGIVGSTPVILANRWRRFDTVLRWQNSSSAVRPMLPVFR